MVSHTTRLVCYAVPRRPLSTLCMGGFLPSVVRSRPSGGHVLAATLRRCLCAARPARPRARARHAAAAASGRRPPSSDSLLRLLCRSVLPKSSAVRWRVVSSLPGRLCAAVGPGRGRGGRCGARGAAGEAGRRRRPAAGRAPIPGVERGRARRCGARVESRACGMAWVPARTERRIRGGLAEAGRSSGRLEACSGAESCFWRVSWAKPGAARLRAC